MDNKLFVPVDGLNIEYLKNRGVKFYPTESKQYVQLELPKSWYVIQDGLYWQYIVDEGGLTVVSIYDIISSRETRCYSLMGLKRPDPWWKWWRKLIYYFLITL